MNIITASAVGGLAGATLLGLLSTLVPFAGVGIAGVVACTTWLKNALKNNK